MCERVCRAPSVCWEGTSVHTHRETQSHTQPVTQHHPHTAIQSHTHSVTHTDPVTHTHTVVHTEPYTVTQSLTNIHPVSHTHTSTGSITGLSESPGQHGPYQVSFKYLKVHFFSWLFSPQNSPETVFSFALWHWLSEEGRPNRKQSVAFSSKLIRPIC